MPFGKYVCSVCQDKCGGIMSWILATNGAQCGACRLVFCESCAKGALFKTCPKCGGALAVLLW